MAETLRYRDEAGVENEYGRAAPTESWWASMRSHQDIFIPLELTPHEVTCRQTGHKIQLWLLLIYSGEWIRRERIEFMLTFAKWKSRVEITMA